MPTTRSTKPVLSTRLAWILVLSIACGSEPSEPAASPEPVTTSGAETSAAPTLDPMGEIEVHEDGVSEGNDSYTVELTWPIFQHPDPAVAEALRAAVREHAMVNGYALEGGSGVERGGCQSRLARAGWVSVTCWVFQDFQSDEEQTGGAAGGCGLPVEGKTWQIVGSELEQVDVRSAFRADADEALRTLCREIVEEEELQGPDPCTRDPLQLVIAEDGVVVLPEYACESGQEGVLLYFDDLAPLHDPDSPLVPLLLHLADQLGDDE